MIPNLVLDLIRLFDWTNGTNATTSDYSNTSLDDSFLEDLLPQGVIIFYTIILALLTIVGLVANILVIIVLVQARLRDQTRCLVASNSSTTDAYILNLSAADLLFLLCCAPFQGTIYILNDWPYGDLVCKAVHFFQFCTQYASIWVLTMMSVDRYVCIGHPLKSVKWRRPRQAMRVSFAVWIGAICLGSPWGYLYEMQQNDGSYVCVDAWEGPHFRFRKFSQLFVFLSGFFIPTVIIFAMAVLIARSIRSATHEPLFTRNGSSTNKRDQKNEVNGSATGGQLRKRRRVGWLVFALSFVFFICWLPQNLFLLWVNFDDTAKTHIEDNPLTFFIVKIICHMFTYMNSVLNPILYSLVSNNFRDRLAYTCGLGGKAKACATVNFNSSCRTLGANRQLGPESTLLHGVGGLNSVSGHGRKASVPTPMFRQASSVGLGMRAKKHSLSEWPTMRRPSAAYVSPQPAPKCRIRKTLITLNDLKEQNELVVPVINKELIKVKKTTI